MHTCMLGVWLYTRIPMHWLQNYNTVNPVSVDSSEASPLSRTAAATDPRTYIWAEPLLLSAHIWGAPPSPQSTQMITTSNCLYMAALAAIDQCLRLSVHLLDSQYHCVNIFVCLWRRKKRCNFNKRGLRSFNMGNNCLSEAKRGLKLAAELDPRTISRGSLDDVRALLRRGAPVNGVHELVNSMHCQSFKSVCKFAVLCRATVLVSVAYLYMYMHVRHAGIFLENRHIMFRLYKAVVRHRWI